MSERNWPESISEAMKAITRTFDGSVALLMGEHRKKPIVDVQLPGGGDE